MNQAKYGRPLRKSKWLKATCNLVRHVKPKELGTLKMFSGWDLMNSNSLFLSNE